MSHIQFNRDSHVELAILLNAGKNQSECARILGMHRVSVCAEIKRNKDPDGVYRSGHAHKQALTRRKQAKKPFRKIENDSDLQKYIIKKTKKYWPLEKIAGRLKKDFEHTIICHETIYQFIYHEKPKLTKYLRHRKSHYQKRRGSHARILLNKASKVRRIDEKPTVIEERSGIGDWENNMVLGKEKTQRALIFTERKSGFGMAEKLDVVTAEIVHQKEVMCLKKIPKEKRLTLTRDGNVSSNSIPFMGTWHE